MTDATETVKVDRTGNVAVMLLVAIFALNVIAILLQVFVLNPTAQHNQDEIADTTQEVQELTCANAEVFANSYRDRLTDKYGQPESITHFRTRMFAQQHSLNLALDAECESAPGFPPFRQQIREALAEIAVILKATAPHPRTSRGPPHVESGSSSPVQDTSGTVAPTMGGAVVTVPSVGGEQSPGGSHHGGGHTQQPTSHPPKHSGGKGQESPAPEQPSSPVATSPPASESTGTTVAPPPPPSEQGNEDEQGQNEGGNGKRSQVPVEIGVPSVCVETPVLRVGCPAK